MTLIDELRPHAIQIGVQTMRQVIGEALRGAPVAAPQRERLRAVGDEHGGCPYCAARTELWLAIGAAVDCEHARDPVAREVYEQKLVTALDAAYRALDTMEVLADRDGAEVAAGVARLAAVRSADYGAQARELYTLKDKCVALAVRRNSRGGTR